MGCREARDPDDSPVADAGASADAFEGLRDDVVTPIGSDLTLDVATWNLEDFPKRDTTVDLVADLIASLRLDLIAVQEITDIDAFDALVARLPDHEGVLSDHVYSSGFYQKVGVIYRADLLTATAHRLLFEDDSWAFPRPVLEVDFELAAATGVELDFKVLSLHLKAGTGFNDSNRRELAFQDIDQHIGAAIIGPDDDDTLILGDFNEVLDTTRGQEVWSPMLGAPERYTVETQIASDNAEYSFLPGDRLLDHIVSTVALSDEIAGRDARIPRIDMELSDYERTVSDHLPVVLSLPIFSSPAP